MSIKSESDGKGKPSAVYIEIWAFRVWILRSRFLFFRTRKTIGYFYQLIIHRRSLMFCRYCRTSSTDLSIAFDVSSSSSGTLVCTGDTSVCVEPSTSIWRSDVLVRYDTECQLTWVDMQDMIRQCNMDRPSHTCKEHHICFPICRDCRLSRRSCT